MVLAVEAVVAVGVAVVVGLVTNSAGWAILAVIGAGLALVVLGSVAFASLGGAPWARRRQGPTD